jgi:oligopeptide/dipeptide ABC transporter ATP-binding protein
MSPTPQLLRVESLRVGYPIRAATWGGRTARVWAVDGVSFAIAAGETLGLVGESGCGKSTLARAVLRLVEPDEGSVWLEGEELTGLAPARLRVLRKRMQIVFQDPASSLNPRLRVGDAVREPLRVHGLCTPTEAPARAAALFEAVGLGAEVIERFPHELSGGQRQRVAIARALAVGPSLVIADEPLSGLDGSVQAQLANLLLDLQEELGLSLLFISHDLRMVAHLADRIAVMYLGKFVEIGPAQRVGAAPAHPYARALWSASARGARGELELLEGEIASPLDPPAGCRFHPRCPRVRAQCRAEEPQLAEVGDGHWAACFWPVVVAGATVAREAG